QELAQLAELGDRQDLAAHTARRLALEVTAELDVLPAARLRLETQGNVEQRTDPPLDEAPAPRRRIDAGQHLQERALARPVVPDDADPLAARYLEADVLQRPYLDVRPNAAAKQPQHPVLPGQPLGILADTERQTHSVQLDTGHSCPQGEIPNPKLEIRNEAGISSLLFRI